VQVVGRDGRVESDPPDAEGARLVRADDLEVPDGAATVRTERTGSGTVRVLTRGETDVVRQAYRPIDDVLAARESLERRAAAAGVAGIAAALVAAWLVRRHVLVPVRALADQADATPRPTRSPGGWTPPATTTSTG